MVRNIAEFCLTNDRDTALVLRELPHTAKILPIFITPNQIESNACPFATCTTLIPWSESEIGVEEFNLSF